MQPIKLEIVKPMVSAGAIRAASIIGQKGGFAVVFNVGMQQQPLATRAGAVRVFSRSDTAIQTLHELGIRQFNVDTRQYQAGTLRAPRPDIRKRHQEAAQAVSHSRWMRGEVQSTLDKIERGEGRWHSLDDVATELHKMVDAHEAAPMAIKPRRKQA